jgi:hypothetical protein
MALPGDLGCQVEILALVLSLDLQGLSHTTKKAEKCAR